MRLSEFHSAKDGWTVFPQAAMNELPDGTSEREIQALSLYRLVENAIGAAPIADPEVEGFWSLKSDHCGWVGVACGDRGVVQRIDLRAKGLTGALPAEWARLTGLKYVNLGNNQLTSGLPSEWSALSDLKQL